MTFERKLTRKVNIGKLSVGGMEPILVQSMTNTDTHDMDATLRQVKELMDAGCDVVRITAPDEESASVFSYIKERGIDIPLVADIHFNHKIALRCIEAGVDKIRINPGNIGSPDGVRAVARAAKQRGVPIRIGVNSGSVEKEILKKYGSPTPEALAESALYHASLLEMCDFNDIVLSVKASTVRDMIAANRILSCRTDYPLHLGVTEAGGGTDAIVKSSVGIGTLLAEGIGDTVRVSLTDDPVKEIYAARKILSSLGLLNSPSMDIVSCPTCGRTKIDLIRLSEEFKERIISEGLEKLNIKVALMGCAVNGPGEAREADIGIAGGVGEAILFKHGEIVRKIDEDKLIDELVSEIRDMTRVK